MATLAKLTLKLVGREGLTVGLRVGLSVGLRVGFKVGELLGFLMGITHKPTQVRLIQTIVNRSFKSTDNVHLKGFEKSARRDPMNLHPTCQLQGRREECVRVTTLTR